MRHPMIVLLAFIVVCLAAGGLGGFITAESVRTWYPGIAKPSWTPPSWLFGPVWTLLYVMMAVAAWMVWRRVGFGTALGVFALQLALNTLWSFLFFGLKAPAIAAVEIVALWGSIVATIALFAAVDVVAAWLLAPYLLWVTFASALNIAIWKLNR